MVIKKTIVMSVFALVIVLTTVCYRNGLFEKHARSTVSLIEALTISPARQQDALDALAKYDNTQLAALFPYLEDHRALASGDVKFLNIHPSAFEETYMTEAHRVDEVVIRYICWRTMQCDPIFPVSDLQNSRHRASDVLKGIAAHTASAPR